MRRTASVRPVLWNLFLGLLKRWWEDGVLPNEAPVFDALKIPLLD
jgi:hypothetical protein